MSETVNSGYEPRCAPHYRLLSEEQIDALHRASLEILETVGVRVMHDGAVAMLADAGCRVATDQVVRMPQWLVEESIRSAPSQVTVFDRNGREAMHLADSRVYFGLGTDLLNTCDLKTGEIRKSVCRDVIDAAIVADACPEIDFIASAGYPGDVAANMACIASFNALVTHSTKPIYFTAAGSADLAVIIEMAAAVAGGDAALRQKPFLIHYAEPASPLVHSFGAVEKLLLATDRGIPLNYVPAILSGGTGPVTLAGAIATANAEALSGLVIQQCRRRGAPMISGFSVTPLDMAYGTSVYGSPETRLTHTACAQLYHRYGIPVWGEAGCSDAKRPDAQAAMESAISILMAAMDGMNLVHDVGYLGQGLIGSPAAIVMGSEIISYVRRILRGFDISRESIDIETIARVGHGGQFLTQKQTARLFREEHWRPRLLDRKNIGGWQQSGGKSYSQRVTERAIEILDTHIPEALPGNVAGELARIMAEAASRIGNAPLCV